MKCRTLTHRACVRGMHFMRRETEGMFAFLACLRPREIGAWAACRLDEVTIPHPDSRMMGQYGARPIAVAFALACSAFFSLLLATRNACTEVNCCVARSRATVRGKGKGEKGGYERLCLPHRILSLTAYETHQLSSRKEKRGARQGVSCSMVSLCDNRT